MSDVADPCIPLASFVKTLNKMADYLDPQTKDHSHRTRELSVLLGERLGFEEKDLTLLGYGADLHDIGKQGVDVSILRQSAHLTEGQRVSVNKHCEFGMAILQYAHLPTLVTDCVLYHQEHWDGSGYPYQLEGDDIPPCARIVCLADVWDSINSNRPYRPKMPFKVAEAFMHINVTWFDPDVFNVWLELLKEGKVQYE